MLHSCRRNYVGLMNVVPYHRHMERHLEILKFTALVKRAFPTYSRFNVFRALREEHDEVRVHSRFIAALIDPRHHSLGVEFLRAFLNELSLSTTGQDAFNVDTARVQTESMGIDILISNGRKRALIIENKIYASDQHRQLRRYYEQAIEDYDEVFMAYLTLDGREAGEASLDGLDREIASKIKNVSYAFHIRSWLRNIEQIAVRDPYLRESVSQYSSLVDKLTGHDFDKGYMSQLVDVLLTNDHIKYARDIRAAYTKALVRLQNRIWTEVLSTIQSSYPVMAELMTEDSLPSDSSGRIKQIERFYQPNAKGRTNYGYYFRTPGYEQIFVAILIEGGFYTGAYCPKGLGIEYDRATSALKHSKLLGQETVNWPIWRRCALSADFMEPDENLLNLLTNDTARIEAVQQTSHDLFVTWCALQRLQLQYPSQLSTQGTAPPI